MKCIILIASLVVATQAFGDLLPGEWQAFKEQHGKVYKNALEERFRMGVYVNNKKLIEEHNAQFEAGKKTFNLKMNQFGDLTKQEFKNTMNGLKKSGRKTSAPLSIFKADPNKSVPDQVDWRVKGAVTKVKDQGQCGSCWAFSTTGSLEGQLFLKKGQLVSLSEQNLVDCSGDYGNMGCNGGLMDNAFQYIKDNGGLDTESSYPYEAVMQIQCKNVGGTDKGYVDIESGSEVALKQAIATVGPISVAIDASNESFQFYNSGVYDESGCDSYSLDHGVLAVGYGTENGRDYWLVKNSWATVWGDQGYIKMARNQDNQCGIATQASYPVV